MGLGIPLPPDLDGNSTGMSYRIDAAMGKVERGQPHWPRSLSPR